MLESIQDCLKGIDIMKLNHAEILLYIKCIGIIATVAYLFYNSFWGFVILLPFTYFLYKGEKIKYRKKQAAIMDNQFKEALISMLAAIKAGYSIENAFVETQKDLEYRFGKTNKMAQELQYINRQVKNSIPIDCLFEEFAIKTGSKDIMDFSDVFKIARRSGGDLGKMMERTIDIISNRMELKQEINLLVASKKYEQQIMNLVPAGIIFYVRLTNPGYFNALYGNIFGIFIMSLALVFYFLSYRLSEKILQIT